MTDSISIGSCPINQGRAAAIISNLTDLKRLNQEHLLMFLAFCRYNGQLSNAALADVRKCYLWQGDAPPVDVNSLARRLEISFELDLKGVTYVATSRGLNMLHEQYFNSFFRLLAVCRFGATLRPEKLTKTLGHARECGLMTQDVIGDDLRNTLTQIPIKVRVSGSLVMKQLATTAVA